VSLRPRAALLSLLVLLGSGSGCASCGQSFLGVISGPINDPSNAGLRKDILRFGLKQFCPELLRHNAPLALQQGTPAIGRFYPKQCAQAELPDGNISVQLAGVGYAWTNLSKKISFTMAGSVTYNADFLMDGSTMYAYFRPVQVTHSDFQMRVIEQPVANFIAQLTPLGNTFGQQLVQGKLAEGFTVIRENDGNADFGLGMIERGKRPQKPFDIKGGDRLTYENTRTEVHQNQRDFVGPIVVQDSGRALYVTATLDGVQAVDVLFLRQAEGEGSLDYYLQYPQTGPLAGAPFVGDVLQAGVQYQRTVPVPPGTYYLVFDNTPTAGQVAPPVNLLDDRAAVISYAVQVGDAP
jgi:hypothetical protein